MTDSILRAIEDACEFPCCHCGAVSFGDAANKCLDEEGCPGLIMNEVLGESCIIEKEDD